MSRYDTDKGKAYTYIQRMLTATYTYLEVYDNLELIMEIKMP